MTAQAGLSDLARVRLLTRELIALLDGVTKVLPTHRPRTLLAARGLLAAVKALPRPEVTDLDLGGVFEQLDAATPDDAGTNSAVTSAE